MVATRLSVLRQRILRSDTWTFVTIGIILFFAFIAVAAYIISPDDTKNANQMHLSIASSGVMSEARVLRIPQATDENNSWFSDLLFGKKSSYSEIPIISCNIQEDCLIAKLYPSGFEKRIFLRDFPKPFIIKENIYRKTFWLGTDKYGRDILSRLIVGTRISISIGVVAVLTSLVIGILMGSIAGYFGGTVDYVITWIINVSWSIPTILLVMSITLALGKGFWQVFVAVGLTMWVEVARVIRGQFLSIKQNEYIKVAKVLGFSHTRIILRHILPNALSPLLVISSTNFAAAILIESGLSFLGLGTQPPTPSWGSIIKQQYSDIIAGKPLSVIAPGLCILILVTAIMILSNKLQSRQIPS